MSKIKLSKKIILINTSSGIVSKAINILLALWLNQYLIQRIPYDEYSLYPVSMSVVLFVSILRSVFSGGLLRHLSVAYTKNDIKQFEEHLSSNVVLQIIGAVIVMILGTLVICFSDLILSISNEYKDDIKIIFFILFLSFSIRQIFIPFEMGLHIHQKFSVINFLDIFTSIIRITLTLLLFKVFRISIVYVVFSYEISLIITAVIRIYLSRRILPNIRFRLRCVKKDNIKSFVSFSKDLLIINLSNRIQESSDPIILNNFSDPFNVTSFYIGSLFRKQILNLQNIFINYLIPGLSAAFAENKEDLIQKTYINFGKFFMLFYFTIITPLLVLRYDFLELYMRKEYLLASRILLILSLDSIFIIGNSLAIAISTARGSLQRLSKLLLILQIINLLLTLLFNIYFSLGAIGCALGTLITNFIFYPILVLPTCFKNANCTIKQYVLNIILPGILPFLCTYYLFAYIISNFLINTASLSWLNLLINAMIIVSVYCILVLFIAINNEERKYLIKAIMNKIKKNDV